MKALYTALAFTLACALVALLGPAPKVAATPAASPCIDGWSVGDWHLPVGGSSGFAAGKLVENQSGQTVLVMDARLAASPGICIDCVQGVIEGRLLDANGNLRYVVRGEYSGVASTGQGSFWAHIYHPGIPQLDPIGKIAGKFSQPPLLPVIGQYKAEWSICF